MYFEMHCLPLKMIILDQHKSDNNNQMILDKRIFVYCWGIMRPPICIWLQLTSDSIICDPFKQWLLYRVRCQYNVTYCRQFFNFDFLHCNPEWRHRQSRKIHSDSDEFGCWSRFFCPRRGAPRRSNWLNHYESSGMFHYNLVAARRHFDHYLLRIGTKKMAK